MSIKCLIIDDEQPARELLENYVGRIALLELVGCFKNPLEALIIMQSQIIDLVFLDIQMPELTGIEFLNSIPNKPQVIFTTAYQQYAIEGYELNVIDYLLKPIAFERFLKGVNKATQQISLLRKTETLTSLHHDPIDKTPEHIIIKADHRIYKVHHQDILYIEGLKEYVAFHTNTQKIVAYKSLKSLEEELPRTFLRIHKSFIVNTEKVKSLYGNQLEIDDKMIPIGMSYKEKVVKYLF
ncbi:MAG: response regulator transcription factor [Bacteroidales bacterium]|nr:response regulator transcription factor [Bacteroidales bacterium]